MRLNSQKIRVDTAEVPGEPPILPELHPLPAKKNHILTIVAQATKQESQTSL